MKRQEELEKLYFRCREIIGFLTNVGALGNRAALFHAAVDEAHSRGNLRALRAASEDLDGRVRRLPPDEIARVQDLLSSSAKGAADDTERINLILQRGTIRSDEEYRLLLNYVEQFWSDPRREAECEAINKLLSAYK